MKYISPKKQFLQLTLICCVIITSAFILACKKSSTELDNCVATQELIQELKPTYLPDTQSLSAGTVIEESQIDMSHLTPYFTAMNILEHDLIYNRITGKSYKKNDHISLADLRYIKLLHYNFKHEIQIGELIVHEALALDILDIFTELFAAEYEIESMYLVDNYWPGDESDGVAGVAADAKSMMQNNTSCFNYRVVPDSNSLSKHALGYAVDINPLQNPYVVFNQTGKQILQGDGDASYIDRDNKRPHMIDHEDFAYRIFSKHGFTWGGDWNSSRDYQHFVKVPF